MNIDPTWNAVLKQWAQFFHSERMPQALLISQEDGSTQTVLAAHLAQGILCKSPEAGLGCGLCTACQLVQAGSHPDFYTLGEPNAPAQIDTVRELIVELQQGAHQEGYQVVILHACDRLSPAVGNALLKTLEEPIGQVLFIGLAQRRHHVMQTLLSRCFKIHLPSTQKIDEEALSAVVKLFKQPTQSGFQDKTIQNWAVEQPQEMLFVLYNEIKERLATCLIQNPVVPHGTTALMKRLIALSERVIEARKQCVMPGINKVLLIESLFYQWQALNQDMLAETKETN